MHDDTFCTLENIQRQTSSSIVSTLLDLQEHGLFDIRSSEWIEQLDILHPIAFNRSRKRRWDGGAVANDAGKKFLGRTHVNAGNWGEQNYIALSYTWKRSPDHSSSRGAYLVQSRNGGFQRTRVRDQVLDRAIAFFNHRKTTEGSVRGFWVDQECIDQADEAEKQCAIQSMERVYSYSACSVALLSVRIESRQHLENLIYILKRDHPPRDQEERRIPYVLNLLEYITSDPWWERGWTFQEDYCASTRMVLLIPHCSSLTDLKVANSDVLDDLKGEICVKSANFRFQATEFCMEYRENPLFKTACDKILDKAGKYNVQLLEPDHEGNATIRRSMSPMVFSNVGKRRVDIDSDRLAVIANCLGYPVRLDTKKVERRKSSLSIAMLALFLLNGEILMNGPSNSRRALRGDIFDYLRNQSLRTFQPPNIDRKLTFIKRCRFPVVELSEKGIHTRGHLWKLGRIVENVRAPQPPRGPDYILNSYQRMRLDQLARHLASGDLGWRDQPMASAIEEYLKKDETWKGEKVTFSKHYKDLMAGEIVKAMDDRDSHRLRLGCIISRKDHQDFSPSQGIFISETDHPWITEEVETYVFTVICPPRKSKDGTEKHVSLEVELRGSPQRRPVQLVIKRWINGLYFYNKSSPITDVVFPWPACLLGR